MKPLKEYIKQILSKLHRNHKKVEVNEEDSKNCVTSLINGFYVDEFGEHYLCTVDNVITCLFNPEDTGIDEAVLNDLIEQMRKDGKKPRYATVNDGKTDAKKHDWHIPEYKNGVFYLDGKKYTD